MCLSSGRTTYIESQTVLASIGDLLEDRDIDELRDYGAREVLFVGTEQELRAGLRSGSSMDGSEGCLDWLRWSQAKGASGRQCERDGIEFIYLVETRGANYSGFGPGDDNSWVGCGCFRLRRNSPD